MSIDAALGNKLQLAISNHQKGLLSEAKILYLEILIDQPGNANLLHMLGVIAYQTGYFENAVAIIGWAICVDPIQETFYSNRGLALRKLKQYDAAIASYDQAIRLKSDYAEAYYNRGNTLEELKQYDAAIASHEEAIRFKFDFAEAYSNRGVSYYKLKQYEAAVASYDLAICFKLDYAEAYSNRGAALNGLKQYDAAIASFDRAIRIKSDYADAYSNCGNVLQDLREYEAAIASYDQAIRFKSDFADAYYNRGNTLRELKRHDAAIASYDQAIAIRGNLPFAHGYRLYCKMLICLWDEFDDELKNIIDKIHGGENASPSFIVLSLVDTLGVQHKAAQTLAEDQHPINTCLGAISKRPRKQRIRIGYYSADFRNHAVSYLIAELLERHDKNRFELYGFSFGPNDHSEMRQRISKAFGQFLEVGNQSDQEVAQLSRNLGIDIAIDLMGYTQNQRTGIFSYRAAPIQVSYLGYSGTMATEYMDYLIADRTLIPEESQKYYSEKIVYLPHSFQVNDTKRAIADKHFPREDLGLPNKGFVFCCFNNNYKITPTIFDCWMRILQAVDGSVLWLFEDNSSAVTNLRKEATRRGIQGDRLIFAKRLPLLEEHLARHRAADLFLDTLPYNAHTTASDALWAGLPLITCIGESFASRVAASLLNAIELPELITTNLNDYESLAIELATHPEKLRNIRQKLNRNRLTTSLFDIERFTKHIENAYVQMYERYQVDQQPDHIYV